MLPKVKQYAITKEPINDTGRIISLIWRSASQLLEHMSLTALRTPPPLTPGFPPQAGRGRNAKCVDHVLEYTRSCDAPLTLLAGITTD
jgi:hypothetical protein